MDHNIATIINYSSNDYRFLDECIKRVRPFSQKIIVAVCDHFFNGDKESREMLHRSYFEHPDCTFVEYQFGEPYGMSPPVCGKEGMERYWRNTSRYVGYHFVEDAEFALFLDAAEICDTRRFIDWLEYSAYRLSAAFQFPGYFYFLRPEYQCQVFFGSMVMVRCDQLGPEMVLSPEGREGIFQAVSGEKEEGTLALDGEPLFHHYSWVRSKSELHKKVKTWGRGGRDKLERLEAEPFLGVGPDPIHGLPYNIVPAEFNPLAIPAHIARTRTLHAGYDVRSYPNVRCVDRSKLLSVFS